MSSRTYQVNHFTIDREAFWIANSSGLATTPSVKRSPIRVSRKICLMRSHQQGLAPLLPFLSIWQNSHACTQSQEKQLKSLYKRHLQNSASTHGTSTSWQNPAIRQSHLMRKNLTKSQPLESDSRSKDGHKFTLPTF